MRRVSFLLLIAVVVGLLVSLPAFGQGVKQMFREARDLIVDLHALNAAAADILVQIDEELDTMIDFIEDAMGADEDTKEAATVALMAAIMIKEDNILGILFPDKDEVLNDLQTFMGDLQSKASELADYMSDTNAAAIDRKITNILTVITYVLDEETTIEDLLGEFTGSDEGLCYDWDLEEFKADATVDDCLAEGLYWLENDDYMTADMMLERAVKLIEDVVMTSKDLIFRKLNFIKRDLRSIDRILARYERKYLRRSPRAELPIVASAEVSAQSVNPITYAREEINGFRIMIIDINNLLLDLNDEFDIVWDWLEEAIYEIDVGDDPIFALSWIDQAIEKKHLTLDEEFYELYAYIEVLILQKEELKAKIEDLCEAGKIKTPKTCERILIKLDVIDQKLEFMLDVLEYLEGLLDDGIDPWDGGEWTPCVEDPVYACVDVDDWLWDAYNHVLTGNYDDAIASIGEALRLLTVAIDKKEGILIGRRGEFAFPGIVKKIESDLRFIDRLLRREERRSGADSRFRGRAELPVFEPMITASPTAFQAEGASSIRVQVFGLDGQLVFDREALGSALAFTGLGNDGRALANGVYLYVITARGPDGQVYQSKVQKLALVR